MAEGFHMELQNLHALCYGMLLSGLVFWGWGVLCRRKGVCSRIWGWSEIPSSFKTGPWALGSGFRELGPNEKTHVLICTWKAASLAKFFVQLACFYVSTLEGFVRAARLQPKSTRNPKP